MQSVNKKWVWLGCGLVLLGVGSTLGATSTGLIFEDVVLEEGATDGSSCYFKIGKDLIFVAMPGSYECELLEPLKGKRVEFRLVMR